MTIVATGPLTGFFHEVVEDAIKTRGVDVTGGATTYLVGLLLDFARLDERKETLERPLAFLLDEALHATIPAERFEKLRTLGDGVLYTSGFFSDHFEARGVDQKYLCGIGTTAYTAASSMLHVSSTAQTEEDVFGELAAKFECFVEVLTEVADTTIAKGAAGSRGLLRVYERWLKTGSDRLARTLSSQGLVPQRGPKGVQ